MAWLETTLRLKKKYIKICLKIDIENINELAGDLLNFPECLHMKLVDGLGCTGFLTQRVRKNLLRVVFNIFLPYSECHF